LGFSVRGLGKLTSFLGNICCTVSYFLRRFYDDGKRGIIFSISEF
jgi:hypothetical protein